MKKRRLSFILSFVMLISLFSPMAYAMEGSDLPFSDIENHWGKNTIITKYNEKIVSGYPDGEFKPNNILTRAELITLINRSFGLSNIDETNYEDVESTDWFVSETAKAKYYDYVEDLNARGNEPATRIEVISMLASLLDIEISDVAKSTFTDTEGLTDKEKGQLEAFAELGYLTGYGDGIVNPNGELKRVEMLTLGEKSLGYIVKTQEDADNIPEGVKVTVISSDVIIEGKNIKDLFISPGVKGKVTIKDTKVENKLEIAAEGTEGNIVLENIQVKELTLKEKSKKTTVEILGGNKTNIENVVIESSGKLIADKNTKVNNVTIKSNKPTIKNLQIEERLKIEREKSNLTLQDTTVKNLEVNAQAEINADKSSEINRLIVNAKAEIKGEAKIRKAYIKADDVTLETKPQQIKVDRGVTADVGGNITTSSNDTPKRTSSSSSRPSTINPTGVEVTGDTIVTRGSSITLTASVSPSNATNKTVTWSSSDERVATVVNGVVTGISTGKVTITASTHNDMSDTHNVTVSVPTPAFPEKTTTRENSGPMQGFVATNISIEDKSIVVAELIEEPVMEGVTKKIRFMSKGIGTTNITVSDDFGNSKIYKVTVESNGTLTIFAEESEIVDNTVPSLGLVGTSVASSDEGVATAELITEMGTDFILITTKGEGSATINVSDSSGNTATINIIVNEIWSITKLDVIKYEASVNNAPIVASAIADIEYNKDTTITDLNITDNFTDSDGDTLTFTADTLPPGITFRDGVFSGTPTTVGTTDVTVTANDSNGGTVTDTFTITVTGISSDATLSQLKIEMPSGYEHAMTPTFVSTTTDYKVWVNHSISSIFLRPTVNESHATFTATINGTPTPVYGTIPLNVGDNIIKVVVTAEDGTKNTYTITVNRSIYFYNVIAGEVFITYYYGSDTDVVIPDAIGGMPVVSIGGFNGKGITSVKIGANVREIGISAFNGGNLKEVNIPITVTAIGMYAFANNNPELVINLEGRKSVDPLPPGFSRPPNPWDYGVTTVNYLGD